MSLLDDYVERFNAGVGSGDWEPMLDLLAPDAELQFSGIPVGPFTGREAIGEAYRVQPPDDQIVLLDRLDDRGAVYAWAREPTRPAGEMHIEAPAGAIVRIRILYGEFSG